MDCSPAELVCGTTPRLPGEFLKLVNAQTLQPDTAFVKNLQATMHIVELTAPQYHGTQ